MLDRQTKQGTTSLVIAAILALAGTSQAGPPLGSSFTYQGNLELLGSPVTGTCDFEFSLWSDELSIDPGDKVGSTIALAVDVADGSFTVELNAADEFGPDAFIGAARWLEIAVCCTSPCGPLTTLDPRLKLTAAPHALALPGLYTEQNATSPNLIGGFSGNTVSAGVSGATIAGGGANVVENRVFDDHGTVGGGSNNEAGSDDANPFTGQSATVSGGSNNTASGSTSTVGGGSSNEASGSFAAIGGGGGNTASGQSSSVGGGSGNVASGSTSTVGGGGSNEASDFFATIGGGVSNTASDNEATVGGGSSNTASGQRSTVSGGQNNTASGIFSTVPGGNFNLAAGSFSFAAGRRAKANHTGAFVWGDWTDADFASTGLNQFLIRAEGGVGIGTNEPTEQLTVAGMIGSTTGGFKLPDGTIIADASDLKDTDTLGSLACAGGEVAKWNGSAWACAADDDTDTLGDLSCASGKVAKWNGLAWACAEDDDGASTLDEAYDGAGLGAGRTISADAGAVEILGSGGLTVAGTIQSGSSIIIDGTANTITSTGDLELHVSDGRALRLETNATSPNIIGGYSGNFVETGAVGATIGGGGANFGESRVFDDYGTIGGGRRNEAGNDDADPLTATFATVGGGIFNTASGFYCTVGGGNDNTASGESSSVGGGLLNTASGSRSTVGGGIADAASGDLSTVGGGGNNTASGGGSTIGGGRFNNASGIEESTVGGGLSNTASGDWATVPGGRLNSAVGDYSFAAGLRAKANNNGMFVWADSTFDDFPTATEPNFTPAVDQFLVRATGGAVFVSAVDPPGNSTAGVELAAGGGSWSSLSSRDAKANVDQVDGREILERLRHLRIATWNYKAQDESIRHIGPMAQDFSDAFGVGEKETMITTIDADGVALAAIQGLFEIAREKDAEIAALRAQMEDRLASLEKKLAELGAKVAE